MADKWLTVSELIEHLKSIRSEHGDLPIYTEYDGSNYPAIVDYVTVELPDNIDGVLDLPKRVVIA